jgi:arginine N-succinyltransferase
VDADGYSPFWEALGRKFFKMDFNEADRITAETNNQFITDLMPKYPIYTELLAQEAQDVIGKTHPDGKGARRLLETEGFRYENCVDIFDAGPTLVVPRDQIRTVKESKILNIRSLEQKHTSLDTYRGLISNNKLKNFRAVFTDVKFLDGEAYVSDQVMAALHLSPGEQARTFVEYIHTI